MNDKFDKTYNEIDVMLEEGKLKSLATAGMIGLGALGGGQGVEASQHDTRPNSSISQYSDGAILSSVKPHTIKYETSNEHRSHVHDDGSGNATIGYGFSLKEIHVQNILKKYGYNPTTLENGTDDIAEEDSYRILGELLEIALNDAKQFVADWDSLHHYAKIILTDMSYQLGSVKLAKFKNMKEGLDSLDYHKASKEMIDSDWYKQSGNRSRYWAKLMNSLAN